MDCDSGIDLVDVPELESDLWDVVVVIFWNLPSILESVTEELVGNRADVSNILLMPCSRIESVPEANLRELRKGIHLILDHLTKHVLGFCESPEVSIPIAVQVDEEVLLLRRFNSYGKIH